MGEDQRQHVELTRNIAQRFNGIYGEVFTMPEAYIPKVAARVMSLSEPDKKMSKSSTNENSYILVMDPPEVILRKFKRARPIWRASTARGRKRPLPWRTGPCVKCIRRWASFPADGGAAQTCLLRRSPTPKTQRSVTIE